MTHDRRAFFIQPTLTCCTMTTRQEGGTHTLPLPLPPPPAVELARFLLYWHRERHGELEEAQATSLCCLGLRTILPRTRLKLHLQTPLRSEQPTSDLNPKRQNIAVATCLGRHKNPVPNKMPIRPIRSLLSCQTHLLSVFIRPLPPNL